MRESSKSKKLWEKNSIEYSVLKGKGIDIGAGTDPILPGVEVFDMEHGDANEISKYVKNTFDFVYASHCLEHMHDPKKTILDWWQLVKPGGHLFFMVPDEDLYEQGVFPSRFNPDHKATFTISKTWSWSPKSINVLDLARSLPGGEIVNIALQDKNYDRELTTFGPRKNSKFLRPILFRAFRWLRKRGTQNRLLTNLLLRYQALDQTAFPETLAQIRCIVRKKFDGQKSDNPQA